MCRPIAMMVRCCPGQCIQQSNAASCQRVYCVAEGRRITPCSTPFSGGTQKQKGGMDEAGTASPPRRRLPTKASSGRISVPSSLCSSSSTSSSTNCEDNSQNSLQPHSPPASPRNNICAHAPSSSSDAAVEARTGAPSTSGSSAPPTRCGPPRTVPKPAPLGTGPLNSTATPHVLALPVKRRGSYQSLKRHGQPAGSAGEEQPSIMSLIKKATHWERFGTILVLGCVSPSEPDGRAVMQMLMAEGYDATVAGSQAAAVSSFGSSEVFPDVVLIDCDLPTYSPLQLISQLQAQNSTVAIICLGSKGGSIDAVSTLQAGAADFMARPIDLDELVARIERHVQRQHCIKLELETAMEDARAMMAQLSTATALGDMMFGARVGKGGGVGGGRLIAVAETEFEQQITELSEENHKLGARLQDLEQRLEVKNSENGMLAEKLGDLEVRMRESIADNTGVKGQLSRVAEQNSAVIDKLDALERIVRRSQEYPRSTGSFDEAGAGEDGCGSGGRSSLPNLGQGGRGGRAGREPSLPEEAEEGEDDEEAVVGR